MLELKAKARRLKAQNNLELIVIDYLRFTNRQGREPSRRFQISRALKGVAKELDVPVIALSTRVQSNALAIIVPSFQTSSPGLSSRMLTVLFVS